MHLFPLFLNRVISISIINDLFTVTFFDFMIIPLYIFSIVNLCKLCRFDLLQKIIMQLGKQSLLMWFVSCIFFNNSKRVFQPVLYFPRNCMTYWVACGTIRILQIIIIRITIAKTRRKTVPSDKIIPASIFFPYRPRTEGILSLKS